jgi:YHS domain-containing protein
MNFIGKVMRFLFWLLIVSWSVALLRRVVRWMLREAMPAQMDHDAAGGGAGTGSGVDNSQDGLAARRLVRDPVCGMHVAEELSIPLREGGDLLHFCSMECRDKYVKSVQRKAANA